jgi:hypothetical protein
MSAAEASRHAGRGQTYPALIAIFRDPRIDRFESHTRHKQFSRRCFSVSCSSLAISLWSLNVPEIEEFRPTFQMASSKI